MENTSIKKEDNSTTENNCLIAEFMGGVFYGPDDLDHPNKWWFQNQPHEGYRKDAHHISAFLRYDKDWSWLMPVVEKIKLQWQNHKVKDVRQDIELICKYNMVLSMLICDQISEVYENIVEFIKWYNTQHENKMV